MRTASFRFYAGLNDFLPQDRQSRAFRFTFNDDQSIKHLIEAFGVPHTEVELILINGEPAAFNSRVQDGDRVSVYPHFQTLDIAALSPVRPAKTRPYTFVVDNHLGKLAAYLRMVGQDTLYRNDYDDAELADLSNREQRVLLTRDQDLLKRRIVTYGYWVRTKDPRRQLLEVLERFDLYGALAPFTRCLRCNGPLAPVPKEEILDQLELKTRLYYDRFARCEDCQQIFWQGSHWERMQRFIETLQPEALDG